MLIFFFIHAAKIFLIVWFVIVLARAKFYLSFMGYGFRESVYPIEVKYFELMQELLFPSGYNTATTDKEKERNVLNFLCRIYWLNAYFILISLGGLLFCRFWQHS